MDYFPNPVSSSGEAVSFPAHTLMGCRLTLESGVPVSTTDQTAKSVVYLCQYTHDRIPLYGSSGWESVVGHGLSLTLAGLTSGKNYDIVGYLNSGTPTLGLMPAWTNDTTRASGIVLTNGVWTNSSSITTVIGGHSVAANRGTVLGTLRTTGTNTTEDSLVNRFIANACNRVERRMFTCPGYSNNSSLNYYSVGTASYEALNGGSGATLNYLVFDAASIKIRVKASLNATYVNFSIGDDSSSPSNFVYRDSVGGEAGTSVDKLQGRHYLTILAKADSTTTINADNGGEFTPDPYYTYFYGEFLQ